MSFSKIASFIFLLPLILWALGYIAFAVAALQIVPEEPDVKTDAIVVLTGGQGRTETGLSLLADGHAKHLFITGVHPHVKRSEIRDLWKGAAPLPNCCIMLGYEARTTQQNAQETREWLQDKNHKSIRLVTGNFHMARALNEFNHTLSDIKIIPHGIVQPRFEPESHRYWVMAFYEYNKALFRWFVLRFENHLPESIVNLQLNPQVMTESGL